MAQNRVIGCNGQLPWRMSTDLQRFKKLTMGHALVMGRKTYDSIGRPLPGRRSIVLTTRFPDGEFRLFQQSAMWAREPPPEGDVHFLTGLEVALSAASALKKEVFVIGGGVVFEETLPFANRIYLSQIEATVKGDTKFPKISMDGWQVVSRESFEKNERNQYRHTFTVLQRFPTLFDFEYIDA